MQTILGYLVATGAFLKALPWYAIALPLVFIGGCCGGCSCERARPHILKAEPETTVLTINGQDVVYDRTPEGGWKRR